MGIAIANSDHVGATPQCTFEWITSGLNTRTKPMTTSSTWVAKSITASVTLSLVASWMPTMLSATSTMITIAPATMSAGFSRNGSQNTDR